VESFEGFTVLINYSP